MGAQHKRPGRTAKLARQARARELEKKRREQLARRAAIVVHFPKRWDPERVDEVSPGRCVAWADGRNLSP